MMARILASLRLDFTVQWRNKLYLVGIGLSLVLGLGLAAALPREQMGTSLPMLFLFSIGGTSLLYVLGLTIFEKDEGTLDALSVSPLQPREYIASKLLTLATLALVESVVTALITVGIGGYQIGWLLLGIGLMSAMLTLLGFIVVVRYDNLTDAFLPALVVLFALQLPALHFLDMAPNNLWFLVPTTAPTMLMWAAWNPVEDWQLMYGVVYSLAVIAGLYVWALAAFRHHLILKRK